MLLSILLYDSGSWWNYETRSYCRRIIM